MRTKGIPILAIAILFLLAVPLVYESGVFSNFSNSKALSSSSFASGPYSENLALYLTSAQALWKADLSGGNINLSTSIPSSVTSFTVSLTHYNTWNSQFEVFTKYGFGYLGHDEPMPNASLLEVDTTSQIDAASLANSLSQKFALTYVPYTSNSTAGTYTFISPMNFATEMHIFFWNLLPHSAGGFANMTSEQSFESQNLIFFQVSYSGGSYSISYGAINPLSSSSSFSLYTQLGVSGLNYSTSATSSNVQIHVLGGFVTNSSVTPTNFPANFSSVITVSKSSTGNGTVPNISASLDFSFPTIVAYRQVSPLDPAVGTNATIAITVKDISPSGSPSANVSLTDNWYTAYGSSLSVRGSSSANYTLSSGQSNTTIYYVAPTTTGAYAISATRISYKFKAANLTITASLFLNNETMFVGSTGAALESWENVSPGTTTISAGQPLTLFVFVKNYGPGGATGVTVAGNSPVTLASGSTVNFTVTSSSSSVTNTNATISYNVSWSDGIGSHIERTNQINAIYSLGNPGSPSTTLSKRIEVSKDKTSANVTLTLSNGGLSSLTNVTIVDPIPSGINFSSSVGNRTVSYSNGLVTANVANLSASASVNYTYSVKITSPSENYVFLPANVSSSWNGVTIVHYSQGAGLPLGVSASKSIVPSAGFQGTTVSERLGVTNNGTLPIFDVTFANSTDTFLSYLNSSKGYTPTLTQGQSVNTTLNVNMTGAPGVYNTSTSAAAFVFAGTNQTAFSNVFKIVIYQNLFESMTALGPKIEENHNINISITVVNPSNATVSNVDYSVNLPPTLKLVSGSPNPSFQISSLGPNQSTTKWFEVTTSIPFSYTIPGGNLTFQYQSKTLKGVTTPLLLNVVDDLLTRYAIPIFIALLIVLGTVVYVRRLVRKTS
ncbi:MAG: hypothetical protein PXY39_04785 [archaeon]|nr:hypothetical protein [archaeon]